MAMKSTKVNQLPPRKYRLVHELAQGVAPAIAAPRAGLKPISAYRALRDPAIQQEIGRLRQGAELALVRSLEHLVTKAVYTLAADLDSPNPRTRLAAAELVLKLGADVAAHEAAVRDAEPDAAIDVDAERINGGDDARGAGDHFQTPTTEGRHYEKSTS